MFQGKQAPVDSASKKHPAMEEVRLGAHTLPEVSLPEEATAAAGSNSRMNFYFHFIHGI